MVSRAVRLAVLFLAFTLWCARIPGPSFWIDEAVAAEIAHRSTVADVWQAVAARERRPPGYHLLLYAWRHAAGESDFALRYPSLMAGTLALAMSMRLGRRWLGRRAALWGGLLIAASPFLTLYVPMARYYSLVWLLVAASWLAFHRWLKHPRRWGAYAAAMLGLAYTDPAIVPTLAGHGLSLALTQPHRLRRWLVIVAILGLASLPWISMLPAQAARDLTRADFSAGTTGVILRLAAPVYAWSVGEAILPWWPLAWPGLIATAALTWLAWRERVSRFWLGASAIIPLLFTAALIAELAPDITFLSVPSRALYAAPALYLAWGAGLNHLSRLPRSRILPWSLTAALLITDLSGLIHLWARRELLNPIYAVPAREIAAQVSAQARPGDLFLADGDSAVARYWPAAHPVRLIESRSPEALTALDARPRRVWLLTLGRDRTRDTTPLAVISYLEAHYRQAAVQGFVPVDPVYRQVKAWLLRRPAYAYKATLTLYDSPGEEHASGP